MTRVLKLGFATLFEKLQIFLTNFEMKLVLDEKKPRRIGKKY
jgi:hypothetical protein